MGLPRPKKIAGRISETSSPFPMSEDTDRPKELDLVVKQILLDALAVLPSRDRAEFQLERFSKARRPLARSSAASRAVGRRSTPCATMRDGTRRSCI
jgi:hypothetical protein